MTAEKGPIEYVGEKKRPSQRRPVGERFRHLITKPWLGIAYVVAIIALVIVAKWVRGWLIALSCDATTCSTTAMSTAGWLLLVLPAALIAVGIVWGRRLPSWARVSVWAVAVLCGLAVFEFMPGKHSDWYDYAIGLGGDQFVRALRWTVAGFLLAGVIVGLAYWVGGKLTMLRRRFAVTAAVITVAVVGAALPWSISRAYPTAVSSAENFPAVLQMNDDTLTLTAAGDRRGCDGVLADAAPLGAHHCRRTIWATYTTDDSDAVATVRAVLYYDEDDAAEVRDGIRDGAAAAGTSGDTITVVSKSSYWVLVGTAGHADGHAIASDERAWVLWPLRQATYHFIGMQVGLLIDPDPEDEIHPRPA